MNVRVSIDLESCSQQRPQLVDSGNNKTGECGGDYRRSNEEQGSFSPGWVDYQYQRNTSNDSVSIRRAFQYRSSAELDTYWYAGDYADYGGGGYVYDFRGPLSQLRGNLSELHRLGWIDDQTRAVMIQISLYNPNIQMFTSVTMLVEFLSTGSLIATARFEPIDLHSELFVFHFGRCRIEDNVFLQRRFLFVVSCDHLVDLSDLHRVCDGR